jgi:hypothetical protein
MKTKDMKKCITCKAQKAAEAFTKNKRYLDNLDSICRSCRKQKRIDYKQFNFSHKVENIKVLEIMQRINKVSKLPKNEQWINYDKILNAVACLNDSVSTEQKDKLKDTLHYLIEKTIPLRS